MVPSTTVVPVTSCDETECSVTSKTTGVVTVSTGSTIYTTYCPLSSSVTIPVPPTTEETTPATTESTSVETQPTTE
ncbi:Cell wall adhesin EAP1, partial [Candida tropicalis]